MANTVIIDVKTNAGKANAEIDSEGIEHHVGSQTLDAIKRFLEK